MLLLDDTSEGAVGVDVRLPPSARLVAEAFATEWPRLASRIELVEDDLSAVPVSAGDVVVSAHACGSLTDRVLSRALEARARVAVLPCCHSRAACDAGSLEGWMEPSLAIDATRAGRLRGAGYRVHTQLVPAAITPKNRLLLGAPDGPR